MKYLLLGLVVVVLAGCSTPPQAPPAAAFQPAFSIRDLEFVLTHLTRFLDAGPSGDPVSAKRLVNARGGLRHRPLAVQLPDRSVFQVQILPSGAILISGQVRNQEPWISVSRTAGEYILSIGPPPGTGGFAQFKISKSGRVSDEGVLIACP